MAFGVLIVAGYERSGAVLLLLREGDNAGGVLSWCLPWLVSVVVSAYRSRWLLGAAGGGVRWSRAC
jgi:hypothetical protein